MKEFRQTWRRNCFSRVEIAAIAVFSCVFVLLFVDAAHAATGDKIFKDAACTLLEDVLTSSDKGFFGAMLTVIAGSLAILSSVMGSFKGAWVLLFVSVATYLAPATVAVLFPDLCGGGG